VSSLRMPNFLIVGAAKSGTTSLYHYLAQHPDVFMSPVKEPNFFALEGEKPNFRAPGADERINRWSVTDPDEYRKLYEGASKESALGEASPVYLYSEKAVGRIKHHLPEARLIVILRNPAERAYSGFLHLLLNGRETVKDFGEALALEEERKRENWDWIWHYKSMGFYHEQLVRYREAFDPEGIKVYLYEDLERNPDWVVRDAYEFLGVDASFVPKPPARYNATGIPRSRRLNDLLRKDNPLKAAIKPFVPKRFRRKLLMNMQNKILVKPPFPERERRQLVEEYREDVLKLQDLIGRDLSGWLR
jgi:hypothetical protein